MARKDWLISRKQIRKTFYSDLPDVVESLRVSHTLTNRNTGLTKIFEQNYQNPEEADLVDNENKWIARLERAELVPMIQMGEIDTSEPVTAQKKTSAFIRALRIVEAINQEINQLEGSAATLKAALPDQAATIEDMVKEKRAEVKVRLAQAREELKK